MSRWETSLRVPHWDNSRREKLHWLWTIKSSERFTDFIDRRICRAKVSAILNWLDSVFTGNLFYKPKQEHNISMIKLINCCGARELEPRGAFNKFPGIWNCRRLLKIQYVIAMHLMRWLTNFYDFTFKGTATAAIGIHPTKAWLSQLVNFKNAIWHFRRTICNKILF